MKMVAQRLGQAVALVAVALICVGGGIGLGRLPIWNRLANAPRAMPAPLPQAVAANDRSPNQRIKVHGSWTIKVLDKGRLVTERRFENALLTVNTIGNGGDTVLANLLTRLYTMGPWQLYAIALDGSLLFQLSSAADIAQQNVNGPLTVSGGTPGHVKLSGTFTAGASINIGKVSTSVSLCPSSTAPASCVNYFGDFFFNFTSTTLSVPVPVANGQEVQVSVDISFS